MRRSRFWPQMTLVFALAVMNGGCLLIPQLKDRLVELALSGTSSTTFTVNGSATAADELATVNVSTELDLQTILNDAGIDVSQVTHIGLSGVSYRIVRADADPSREITGGTITIQRGIAGAVENLVTGFSAAPGAVSGYQNVTLDAAGVAVVNALLADILEDLKGTPNPEPSATFHLTGNMTSTSGTAADFDVELKVTIGITGTITVSVPT